MYVRRPTGSRYSEKFCAKTVKNAPYWMIWGSFSASGRGNLYFLPQNTTMNGAQHLSVLKERLKPIMRTRNCTMFMHDGAPCHASRRVKSWLQNKGIEVLGLRSGQSPDFNPIKKLWHILKMKVYKQKPTTLSQLRETILRVWCIPCLNESLMC